MHKLAGITFVQSVESPVLAMVVPLLLRGIVVISHNNEFCKNVSNQEYLMSDGYLKLQNENWMDSTNKDEKIQNQEQITELTDEHGNTVKIKIKKVYNKRECKIMMKKVKKLIEKGDELDEEEYNFAIEENLL